MELVVPSTDYLAGYVDALQRRWSPNTMRPEACDEMLAEIASNADRFLAYGSGRDTNPAPLLLPDGSEVARLPGFARWMWDGQFCGSINFRWAPGTTELPPYVLGHIGYAVVDWKQRRGHATSALRQLLTEVRTTGLPYVELTTDASNAASQRVIQHNGGTMVERFISAIYGPPEKLRWHIALTY